MATTEDTDDDGQFSNYAATEDGFSEYLRDIADELFPFPGYREHQDEILYETLEAFFLGGYRNVIIEGPTGIGKSPVNVTVGRVFTVLSRNQAEVFDHFGVDVDLRYDGKSFYTTPQKSLRNQLAEDEDLQEHIAMLKGRRDYVCQATGKNCADCPVRSNPDESCLTTGGCTYWSAKVDAMESQNATITFAMLIVDKYLPVMTEDGVQMSFDNRDLVTVDEGHNSEGQASSMFAGFTLSPYSVPPEVYGDAGEKVNWSDERLDAVEFALVEIRQRCTEFIRKHENNEQKQSAVEKCENMERKLAYALETHRDGAGWVVNIEESAKRQGNGTTKKIEVKPVRVDDFLSNYVWSRGKRRLVTSATIPFRGNVDEWTDRIGLNGQTKFVSKPTPFPKSHRQIHLNTIVGEMSGEKEDENWGEAMTQIEEISSYHEGENGLIHSVSYPRAEEVGDSLGRDNLIVDDQEKESDAMIQKWQNSDKDIMVSPRMTEGVDLHGDKCRWQVLLKVPFAYYGDSRVSYLLDEENEWNWYFEEAGIDIIQSVGRAVRGGEPEEAASFYVIDSKFEDVMYRTNPPNYFLEAIEDDAPLHWQFPKTAPWRGQ